MKEDTIISKKIQEQIAKFSSRVTQGYSKPKKRFISQILYGIQASRDIKLSNISRSLDEDIKLIKTENRLSRNITDKDLTAGINEVLIKDSKWKIEKDTVLALDLSDINKEFAQKMDYLGGVWDGSKGETSQGYWICEVIGAAIRGETPIPMYSELYSHKAKGFKSENDQIIRAIEAVNEQVKGRGIWAMDRGADRKLLVDKLNKMGLRFVIRSKGNRIVIDERCQQRHIANIVKRIRYTGHYTVKIDKEGYEEEVEIQLGSRDNLKINGVKISLVVIKGFGKTPMILMTNVEKRMEEILEIYLTRWKCEEAFRFLKQEYQLEDVRVRRYIGLRNTVVLLHAVFYFLSVYLGRRMKLRVLMHKILERAKRFFQTPIFKQYALADGIHRLLFNKRWIFMEPLELVSDQRQLMLDFG